jgi:hypothetical protein
MKTKPKSPGIKRFKLKCEILLSSSAFKFNLRRYTKMPMPTAALCFAESRGTNERKLDFRTFLGALGSVAGHMGVPFDDVVAVVKALPVPDRPVGSVPVGLTSFTAPRAQPSFTGGGGIGSSGGRGLHSFPFQLILSSSAHRITQINS